MTMQYLEGRKFCVVLVKEVPENSASARLQCLHGRASVENGSLFLIDPQGGKFPVPNSALHNIMPSDGTALLKDAEYFVMVKLHWDIDFLEPSSH